MVGLPILTSDMAKKRASLGVLFWIAFILFILVVFLFNRSNIEEVLERTQLVEVVRDRIGVEPREPTVEVNGPATESPTDEEQTDAEESQAPADEADGTEDSVEVVVDPEPLPPRDETPPEDEPEDENADEPATDVVVESTPRPNVRSARIYFIRVTDEGRILPYDVERDVTYRDSPMTETLRVLIEGPTADELNLGLLNLIPAGTELLSASVQDGTAFLNFNEAFKFNTMGAEGAIAQLQQVVFSSTEFSTVSSVQILIEGQKLDYLGGEGIYIGAPLDRSSFG